MQARTPPRNAEEVAEVARTGAHRKEGVPGALKAATRLSAGGHPLPIQPNAQSNGGHHDTRPSCGDTNGSAATRWEWTSVRGERTTPTRESARLQNRMLPPCASERYPGRGRGRAPQGAPAPDGPPPPMTYGTGQRRGPTLPWARRRPQRSHPNPPEPRAGSRRTQIAPSWRAGS